MAIQYLARDAPTVYLPQGDDQKAYEYYVTSYSTLDRTENVPAVKNWPFLKSLESNLSMRKDGAGWSSPSAEQDELQAARVDLDTLKLTHRGTETFQHRIDDPEEEKVRGSLRSGMANASRVFEEAPSPGWMENRIEGVEEMG